MKLLEIRPKSPHICIFKKQHLNLLKGLTNDKICPIWAQSDPFSDIFLNYKPLCVQDHVAHWDVLQDLARHRTEAGPGAENLGTYGPGASKLEIQSLIHVSTN